MTDLNIPVLALIISSILGVVSGVLQLAGKTGLSKAVGTISLTDIGGLLRLVKENIDKRKAAKVAKINALMIVLLASGCGFIQSPATWDAAEKACILVLTSRTEVVAEAKARNLTGQEWAAAICKISDIVEPFLVETDTKAAGDRAILLARPRGLVR